MLIELSSAGLLMFNKNETLVTTQKLPPKVAVSTKTQISHWRKYDNYLLHGGELDEKIDTILTSVQ